MQTSACEPASRSQHPHSPIGGAVTMPHGRAVVPPKHSPRGQLDAPRATGQRRRGGSEGGGPRGTKEGQSPDWTTCRASPPEGRGIQRRRPMTSEARSRVVPPKESEDLQVGNEPFLARPPRTGFLVLHRLTAHSHRTGNLAHRESRCSAQLPTFVRRWKFAQGLDRGSQLSESHVARMGSPRGAR